jgi:hypothetical protein
LKNQTNIFFIAIKTRMSECPICMESIKEDEDILITKCKHKFHATCAFQNTKTNGYKCPNCRGSLLPTQANVITIQETQVDVSGNNINSIIEIINSRPYEPDPRFADVSSNNRRFIAVSDSGRQALGELTTANEAEDVYDQALALLGNRIFDDSDRT